MEDLIYILIGVAWVAYSVYSQNQKQKRKRQAESEFVDTEESPEIEEKPKPLFEEKFNLESIFNFEEKKEEYLDSPYSEIDVVEEKDNSAYFNPETEGVSAFKEEKEDAAEIENVDEIKKSEANEKLNDITLNIAEIIEDFDIKKAVIYSEILNAPYIKNSGR